MQTHAERLADLVVRFTDALNRDDLDAVMSFFDADAIYDEFNGTRNCDTEDLFVEAAPSARLADCPTVRFPIQFRRFLPHLPPSIHKVFDL